MAATFFKLKLSGSVNGRGVTIVATTSGGTTIHTATNVADTLDEVWLWAVNHGSAQADLVIEAGGSTVSGDRIEVGVPPTQGLIAALPGFVYSGGVVISAYGSLASGITIHGFVNRITQS